ncbi:MAG TPA: hypothetical protein VI479_10805, partial [Blastocatellia bacterium]
WSAPGYARLPARSRGLYPIGEPGAFMDHIGIENARVRLLRLIPETARWEARVPRRAPSIS